MRWTVLSWPSCKSAQRLIEPLAHTCGAVIRGDELRVDANRIANLADAALQHITDAELPTDVAKVHCLAAIREGRFARDDHRTVEMRQVGGQILRNTIREIVFVRDRCSGW